MSLVCQSLFVGRRVVVIITALTASIYRYPVSNERLSIKLVTLDHAYLYCDVTAHACSEVDPERLQHAAVLIVSIV